MLCMEAVETYLPYVPKQEVEWQKLMIKQSLQRIKILEKRSKVELVPKIKEFMGKVHFAGVMMIHNFIEFEAIKLNHKY